jgi:nucleoside phosphorylase
MNLLVTAALHYEIRDLIIFFRAKQFYNHKGTRIYRRSLNGNTILFCITGVGPRPVRSFYKELKKFDFPVDLWISTGFAGALKNEMKAGDIVICSGNVFSPAGTFEIRKTAIYDEIFKLFVYGTDHYGMDIYSSSEFLDRKDKIEITKKFPSAGFTDMESCEIAAIAHREDIPLVIIRCITDEKGLELPAAKVLKDFQLSGNLKNISMSRLLREIRVIFNFSSFFKNIGRARSELSKTIKYLLKELCSGC